MRRRLVLAAQNRVGNRLNETAPQGLGRHQTEKILGRPVEKHDTAVRIGDDERIGHRLQDAVDLLPGVPDLGQGFPQVSDIPPVLFGEASILGLEACIFRPQHRNVAERPAVHRFRSPVHLSPLFISRPDSRL